MTKFLKKDQLTSSWYEIDAKNAVVGRLATIVSKIIRGKNKTTFTPHMDDGDFVVVKNIEYIKSVKIQGEGYLVNGSLSVPKADGNRHYEDLKVWLESNTPEPEFTPEEILAQEQATFRAERNQLLDEVVDHYQKPLVWETLTAEKQEEIRAYRQALLDSTISWVLPAKPE